MNFLPSLFVKQKQKACGGRWAVSGTIFLSYYIRRLKIRNTQTSIQAYKMMHDCLPVGMEGTPKGCRRIIPSTPRYMCRLFLRCLQWHQLYQPLGCRHMAPTEAARVPS